MDILAIMEGEGNEIFNRNSPLSEQGFFPKRMRYEML